MPESQVCRNCDGAAVFCHGRCKACDSYWRRTGTERPESAIVAHGRRILERDLANQASFAGRRRISPKLERFAVDPEPGECTITLEQWRRIHGVSVPA